MKLRSYAFEEFKSVAEKFGFFVSREPFGRNEHLKEFLAWARINCVLDVGAYVGGYASEVRELGYQDRIISFEPFPDSFAAMSMKLKGDNNWIGQPYGLSDATSESTIYTHASGDFNSLLVLKEEAEEAYQLDKSRRGETPIALRRLDEVLLPLLKGIDSPRIFLKIDTQGHDLSVLRGAAGVRKWIFGLQSELPVIPIYRGMHSMSQILESYQKDGFVPVGFYPVNTFREKQISPEFDVIFNSYDEKLEWGS